MIGSVDFALAVHAFSYPGFRDFALDSSKCNRIQLNSIEPYFFSGKNSTFKENYGIVKKKKIDRDNVMKLVQLNFEGDRVSRFCSRSNRVWLPPPSGQYSFNSIHITLRQKIRRCSNSREFTFFTFSKKVIKTCPKPVKNEVPESACVKA